MSEENVFLDGLIFKLPRPTAPEFVKGSISIKRENLIATLSGMTEEWINLDLLESKQGKGYAKINNWKKEEGYAKSEENNGEVGNYNKQEKSETDDINVEDIPF